MDRYDILKVIIDNGRALREMYNELLCPFFNVKKIREWRNMLYQLGIEEWIKDRIWEYLNGDIELEELILIYARSNKINDKGFQHKEIGI